MQILGKGILTILPATNFCARCNAMQNKTNGTKFKLVTHRGELFCVLAANKIWSVLKSIFKTHESKSSSADLYR